MEELYNKDLNEPDYYDGVISHPEPDILECEVKWVLGSTAVNKASGCDGIPVDLFKTLKDDAIKVFHSVCQQIWKTQQWLQDWKRSLIPIPKTIALISYVGKVMLKILHGRLQHYVNQEFPDINLGLEKAGARDQIANICWIIEKQGNSRKTSTSVSSTMLSL